MWQQVQEILLQITTDILSHIGILIVLLAYFFIVKLQYSQESCVQNDNL